MFLGIMFFFSSHVRFVIFVYDQVPFSNVSFFFKWIYLFFFLLFSVLCLPRGEFGDQFPIGVWGMFPLFLQLSDFFQNSDSFLSQFALVEVQICLKINIKRKCRTNSRVFVIYLHCGYFTCFAIIKWYYKFLIISKLTILFREQKSYKREIVAHALLFFVYHFRFFILM